MSVLLKSSSVKKGKDGSESLELLIHLYFAYLNCELTCLLYNFSINFSFNL